MTWSPPALKRRSWLVEQAGDYTTTRFHHLRDGTVIGDGLRSQTDERQATEVSVAVHVLNRMLELGRPNTVRTV